MSEVSSGEQTFVQLRTGFRYRVPPAPSPPSPRFYLPHLRGSRSSLRHTPSSKSRLAGIPARLQSLPWLVTSSKGDHFGLPGLFSLLNSSLSLTQSSSLIMFASFSYSSFFFFFFPCILAPVTVFLSSVYNFVSNGP